MAAGETSRLVHAVLIGAGRMGSAMARGWLGDLAGAGLSALSVVEPHPGEDVTHAASAGMIALNPPPQPAGILILAIKPQTFPASAEALKAWIGPGTLVISIMAGMTLTRIAASLGADRIVRAMPNTPGAIGMGATGFAVSPACSQDDVAAASRLLEPLGLVAGPLPEAQMDAVTAVSGSGPAYVFLLVEALAAAGEAAGLDKATANALARETIIGAGALLGEFAEPPEDLRKAVTSPGGTTAAALEVLMAPGGLADLMRNAIEAAVRRGGELAKSAV